MKTGLLCLGLVVSVLGMGVGYGAGEPEGVPWAEWRFASDFDPAHEISADKSSDPDSLIRRNPASAAISISGGKVVFMQTGPDDFLRVDVDDLVENGGGGYVNEYTMIFDLKAMDADWLPIYNTGYNNYNAADFWAAADGSVGSGSYSDPGVLPLETWVRLVVVRRLEGGSWVRDVYANGTKVFDNLGAEVLDDNSSLYTNAQQGEGQFTILSDSDATPYAGCELDNFAFVAAALSDAEVADLGAYRTQGIFGVMGLASEPAPANEATDVPCDSDLSWTSAETAQTHDVYLGTNWSDVNDAGRADPRSVLVGQDQADATFDPDGLLEYGQTYYWRIDEVNGAPDYTVFKGEVWSFTTEPYAYPIAGLTVEASGEQPSSPAIRTIDRSGLDEFDQHGVDTKQMWLTPGGLPAWIQYTFDKEYKVHELWVWNSNSELEMSIGFGAKDVTIEYSTDGETWTTLENVPEFAQGTAKTTYTANTVVSFGGVVAKYVRLTVNAAYGATGIVGLSEVRFFYVPKQAFGPDPADGATGVSVDAELGWRPGREATSHTAYVDVDEAAV
ncbi:MAG: discoidin domain-containing protein, partial [Phycisphaerales bacterium]